MNTREQEVRLSRRLLSDKRLQAFLRAAQVHTAVHAVHLINRAIDDGQTLDSIFYTGDAFGFSLNVSQISLDKVTIEFGCQVAPEAGDGGSWVVTFEGDTVVSLASDSEWIS